MSNILDNKLIEVFALFGFMFVTVLAFLIFFAIKEEVGEYIKAKKYEYKRNHRFDKKPTAKCYCIDCMYKNSNNDKCFIENRNHRYDAWFCADAEPKKFDT